MHTTAINDNIRFLATKNLQIEESKVQSLELIALTAQFCSYNFEFFAKTGQKKKKNYYQYNQ